MATSPADSAPTGTSTSPADPIAPIPLGGPAPVGSFVLGDSIALGVAPALSRLGYPVVGIVGRAAGDAYLREHLTTPLAQQAPAWVIVLGTNNRGDATDVTRLEEWIDLIDSLRTPGDRQRVFWVTPHRDPRHSGGMATSSLDAFNAELGRLADERRWLGIIDFAATARLHPEWYDADGGRVHPDALGQGVLTALIAGPDALPAPTPAPVSSGSPTPSVRQSQAPGPEDVVEFENASDPSPSPTPSALPAPSQPADPQPTSPDASSDMAAPPAPAPTTTDEASGVAAPATAG